MSCVLCSERLATTLAEDMEIIGSGCLVFISCGISNEIRLLARKNCQFHCTGPAGSNGLSENYNGIASLNAIVHRLDEVAAAV